ncbi:MAG: DNA gyrase inhibitor YacG [Thiohalocapsa sp.]|nr:DNA gyrase inhibitor YacG [Thiohalocapsa sp.]
MSKTVNCPTCGRQVRWEPASTYRPFCSERCRLIDLGDWLDESHRISEPADGRLADDWGSEPQDDETAGRPHH